MSGGVEVRRFTPADLPRVVELARTALGEGSAPRTVDYWRWKHLESPFGPSPGLVAEHDGELVGIRLFLRWRLRAGGREVAAVRAVDTATHPAWQGRGVFRRLTEELVAEVAAEGAALVFNTPNRASRSGYLKMGWTDVGRVPARAGRPAPLRLAGRLLRSRARADRGTPRAPGRGPPGGLAPVDDLLSAPRLPALLAAWGREEARLHTPRSVEYLRWRYASVPGLRYHAAWELDGEAGAAVVLRLRRRGFCREVALCEVLASPDPRGVAAARALIRAAVRAAGGDYAAAAAVRGTAEARILGRTGLVPLPVPGRRFTVRSLGDRPAGADPRRWSAWRLSLGDLELM